ncbi:amidohydrolase family protein [Dactylosporangium fulvum]|uniref:Amidohydrolase family protein n=1 Tax=Dactylosporangium fulvum TaxID=53359 RepID=A0ABY5W377_9ACTN|nr:amidohydrolase family protein [Dactylosporangium fulvum]UWP83904.1 amidohydrolase family protein [Dactylosporangium fulvum]
MDDLLDGLGLVDGHCHGVVGGPLDADAFAMLSTEASVPAPPGVSYLDGPIGSAIRRWCAPVLDLPVHTPVADYLARRAELGAERACRLLLRAARLTDLLVDTGIRGPADRWLDGDGLAAAAGARVTEVVRLEAVAERVAASGVTAAGFAPAFAAALTDATSAAVAVKSVLAYRHGFDIDPSRPSAQEVTVSAGGWLRSGTARLTDPVLLRHLLWCAVDAGLPIQLHTGFGDRDLALPRADPSLLRRWYEQAEPSGVPIVLLHCYPFHRQAGWLAQVYPNVYVDVGLTLGNVGAQATTVLGEFFELAPFGKILYSSDAFGLAELFLVGASQFRWALTHLLSAWLAAGAVSAADAEHLTRAVGTDNARRVYRLRTA